MKSTARLFAAVVVAAVVGAACGGGGGGGSNGNGGDTFKLVSQALSKTTSQSARISAKFSISGVSSMPQGGFSFTLSGLEDFQKHVGKFSGSIPVLGGKIEEILDGTTVYLKSPISIGDKPWLKIDLSKSGLASAGLTSGSSDPTQALQYLLGASSNVKDLGTDTIRGQSTHHLQVTVDLRKAAGKLSGQFKSAFEAGLKALGTDQLPMDVWVDDQGRVNRISFQLNVSTPTTPGASPQKATVSTTIDIYDFGVAVNVQPPPASQVTDFSGLVASTPTPSST